MRPTAAALCGCPCGNAAAQHNPEPAEGLTTDLSASRSVVHVADAIRSGHNWGTAIIAQTPLSMTTVYSVLRRLRAAGWAETEVEAQADADRERRPQRIVYRLTAKALEALGCPDAER